MTVYIRKVKFPVEVTINKYNAYVGAYLRGEEVVTYQSFHEIPYLTKEDVVIDYLNKTKALLNSMAITPEELDYPEELRYYLGRRIVPGIMSDVGPELFGKFIKSRVGAKVISGRIIKDHQDLIGLNAEPDYPIWISDPITFLHEWRVFVLNGEVLDVRSYKGDYHYAYDASRIDDMISAYHSSPKAYALDIGIAEDGETYLVEVNDGFSVGNYGLFRTQALVFHATRWPKLTKDYFTSNDKFFITDEMLMGL